MSFPFVKRIGRKLRSVSQPKAAKLDPLLRYDFRAGEAFQIFSIKNKRLYEHLALGNALLEGRSDMFHRWVHPVLGRLEGQTFCVHLGDAPCREIAEKMPNLCYCKKKDDERDLRLIPDAHYQWLKGYVKNRKYRKLYQIRWDKKIEKVIFRGSCTGAKPLDKNLRAQLCSLDHPLIDAQITRVNNGWEEQDIRHLLGNHMSKYEMGQYKYQVDVDGNTNAWDAFFWKLMSGSLTFKLSSEWHQWYYPQIQADKHYVEISDFDDLIEKVKFYQEHDDLARSIAMNARDFTKNLGFKDQYAVLFQALEC